MVLLLGIPQLSFCCSVSLLVLKFLKRNRFWLFRISGPDQVGLFFQSYREQVLLEIVISGRVSWSLSVFGRELGVGSSLSSRCCCWRA